jgi:hypothetical protein
VEQLERCHDNFSREQILVLLYDDFRDDNAAVVRRVLEFLDADPSLEIEALKVNPTIALRSERIADAARNLPLKDYDGAPTPIISGNVSL